VAVIRLLRRVVVVAVELAVIVCLLSPSRIQVDPPYQRWADEAAAIKAIQTIHTMQVQYNSEHGVYAASLAELTGTDSGLASGVRRGYKFTVTAHQDRYAISAVPSVYGNTGSRTFYSDQSMVIRENDSPEPATASSEELQ
jgi:type IV pilus assembly protein PilA